MGRGGHGHGGWGHGGWGPGGWGHGGWGHGGGWYVGGPILVGGGYYAGGAYYGPGGIVVRQRPTLVIKLHSGQGLKDRGWTGKQDVQCVVFCYYNNQPVSSGKSGVAPSAGQCPVWHHGGTVSLALPPHRDLRLDLVSIVVQIRCANTFMGDQVVGSTHNNARDCADGQPRDTSVDPQGTLTWSVTYVPGDVAQPQAMAMAQPKPVVATPDVPQYAQAVYADDVGEVLKVEPPVGHQDPAKYERKAKVDPANPF